MKKFLNFIKNSYNKLFSIYNGKSTKEQILLSLAFLLGALWPIAGLIIFVIGKFVYKKINDYGKVAMAGAIINFVFYFLQVGLSIINEASKLQQ